MSEENKRIFNWENFIKENDSSVYDTDNDTISSYLVSDDNKFSEAMSTNRGTKKDNFNSNSSYGSNSLLSCVLFLHKSTGPVNLLDSSMPNSAFISIDTCRSDSDNYSGR